MFWITEFGKTVFGRCLVNPLIQYRGCLFFHIYNYFLSFEAGNCVSNSSFEQTKNRNKQSSSTRVKNNQFEREIFKVKYYPTVQSKLPYYDYILLGKIEWIIFKHQFTSRILQAIHLDGSYWLFVCDSAESLYVYVVVLLNHCLFM